jgi:hypothetical protein
MADPYVSARFKLWAEVYDYDDVLVDEIRDVISASASFALNTIPTATLVLAVGYNPVTDEPATIHKLKDKLEPRYRVIVKLTVIEGSGDTSKLAPGTYTVFNGFLAGLGLQRSQNQFSYTMNLVHWLDDLNNSSAVNGNWFPGAPQDYAQTAVADVYGDNAIISNGARPGLAPSLCTDVNIQKDIWNSIIKPMFITIAGFPNGITQSESGSVADAKYVEKNDAAVRALDRMPGAGSGYYKPLGLKIFKDAPVNLSASMSNYLTTTIGTSTAQTSFWGKLISEYSAQFLFAISPAVDWALPIPFCSGLRWKEGGGTIKISDYSYGAFNANMTQIIESVNILYAMDTKTGIDVTRPNGVRAKIAPNYYKPCAQYPATTAANKRGLKLFKNPPGWFLNLGAAHLSGAYSAVGARTTTAPNAGTEPAAGGPATAADATAAHKSTLELFAQQWYVNEVLQQRYGELSGPLRFDIAPGSIVKIELPQSDAHKEKKAQNTDEYIVASVMSVSYVINAERATAGTSFAIAHTKTQHENTLADYTVDVPPLYPEAEWPGGPLAVPSAT